MATSTKRLLEQFTDGQLDLEVARREREKKEAEPPDLRIGPCNFTPLMNACKEHLACLRASGHRGDMSKECVYKAAMEYAYGGAVYEWIKKHI